MGAPMEEKTSRIVYVIGKLCAGNEPRLPFLYEVVADMHKRGEVVPWRFARSAASLLFGYGDAKCLSTAMLPYGGSIATHDRPKTTAAAAGNVCHVEDAG